MDADVILVCEGIGRNVSDDPAADLRTLKELRLIFKSGKILYGERVFPLKMKNQKFKQKRQDRAKNDALEKCWILGRYAEWIFFIAPAKSLMQLLAIRDLPLHEMTETELCNLLREKRG